MMYLAEVILNGGCLVIALRSCCCSRSIDSSNYCSYGMKPYMEYCLKGPPEMVSEGG